MFHLYPGTSFLIKLLFFIVMKCTIYYKTWPALSFVLRVTTILHKSRFPFCFLHFTIFYKTWLSFWPPATTQTTRGLSTSKNLRWDFKSLIINKWCSKKLRIPHHVGIHMRWIIIRKQNIHKIFAHCKYVLLSPVSCCQVLKATSCSNSCYVKE